MYQKSDSVVTPAKEAPFMERMYMKIESICVEADKNPSLLFQEAGKYFETQVATAGANMRKLCSELIRDLIPPPEECKHAEKCHCNNSKTALTPSPDQQGDQQGASDSVFLLLLVSAAADAQATAPETLESEQDNDTVVEAGEQVAQWYVSDDYRRRSGIVDSQNANIVSSSKDARNESDSDEWEIL